MVEIVKYRPLYFLFIIIILREREGGSMCVGGKGRGTERES